MLVPILIVLVILLILGAVPALPSIRKWNLMPTAALGLIVLVMLTLLLAGQIA